MQNELRDQQRAIEEVGFANFGDAAINQDTGIEKFSILVGRRRSNVRTQDSLQRFGLEEDGFLRAEHDADVSECEKRSVGKKRFRGLRRRCAEDEYCHEQRSERAEEASHHAAEKRGSRRIAQLVFSGDNRERKRKSRARSGPTMQS